MKIDDLRQPQPDPTDMAPGILAPPEIGKFTRPAQLMMHIGGKWKWSSFLHDEAIPLAVANDDDELEPFNFLDVFGGSGIVTYTMMAGDLAELVDKAYYNEYDKTIYNLFKQVKAEPEQLLQRVRKLMDEVFLPTARYDKKASEGFYAIKEMLEDKNADTITRAAAQMIVKKSSYWGNGKSPNKVLTTDNMVKSLPMWAAAFASVTVWNKSFEKAIEDFIQQNPRAKRVVFVDPPYAGSDASDQYASNLSDEQHQQLANIIHDRKCTYILTHGVTDKFVEIYGPAVKEADEIIRVLVRYKEKSGSNRNEEYLMIWKQK